MKTLTILSLVLFLASCGGEDSDPKPKYNCEQLQFDADRAKTAFESVARNTLPHNATQAAKDQWNESYRTTKQTWVDAVKLLDQHCK